MGEGDNTKVPGTEPSHWELICSEFSDIFEKPGTPPERAIKHEIDLLPDTVLPAMRYYRMSPVKLVKVRKQLDTHLSQGWIRSSTSPYGAPIFFLGRKIEP